MLGTAHEYKLLIQEYHLDTFGHVNNAVYLQLFEQARWDLITNNGYGLNEVHRLKIGPTILEVNVRFSRELRNRQMITIKTWLDSYQGKVGKLVQQILDDAGKICCEAVFTMGLVDLNARKLILPTPEWLKAMGIGAEDLTPPAAT
jgi:YbgC/YbaW family acyl-CoA thioester hydrolase